MDVFEAIHNRVSIGKMKPDPVPRQMIEKLLSAAVQAPNHYLVRPWRFVVLTGNGREKLGDVMAESLKEKQPDFPPEAFSKESSRPLRAPVVIAVGVDNPNEAKVDEVENICAAAAAIENMLLAAHAEGLGAKWRTGAPANDPNVKQFLGFDSDQHLIGFVYIGYPEFLPKAKSRPSYKDRTIWIE